LHPAHCIRKNLFSFVFGEPVFEANLNILSIYDKTVIVQAISLFENYKEYLEDGRERGVLSFTDRKPSD